MAGKQIKTDDCCDDSMSISPPRILPDDMIFEILKRLPTRSLMRFKCVCRDWMRLCCDPQFHETRLLNFQPRSEASHVLFLGRGSGVLATDQNLVRVESVVPANQDLFSFYKPCSNFVNGLICLRGGTGIMIYNLSTGEKRNLPRARFKLKATFALGFDPVSKKYKVLYFGGVQGSKILTVGRNSSWEDLVDAPKITSFYRFSHIHLAGKIYFTQQNFFGPFLLHFFDLASEKYGTIDPPSDCDTHYQYPCVVDAGGYLGLFTCHSNRQQFRPGSSLIRYKLWVLDLIWVERGTFFIHKNKICVGAGTGVILLDPSKIFLVDPVTSRQSEEKIGNQEGSCYTHVCCNHVENMLPLSTMD